jgi:hypothetical protein
MREAASFAPRTEEAPLARRFLRWLPATVVLAALISASPAAADIAPPWCGTPEPDAAGNLPATGPGNFAHIPYYAIKCTLDDIQSRSLDARMSVEQIGVSALGRPLYSIVINQLQTGTQKQAYFRWQHLREQALTEPAAAQATLATFGDDIKVPLYVQAGIHGNEYEGVDASMRQIERLATTPYGTDPEVDNILDHAVVVYNIDQNPDGRALGQRANGFNFDLNRDFLTQSQSETKASVALMQDWLFPDMVDQHGYVTPTLVEATTKPHNPGIEYPFFLKWNQARLDANEAAMNAAGKQIQRPINDWCSNADLPGPSGCPDGRPPGPASAEGWDDWGPFYTPMYNQLVGMNGSTVEMCSGTVCGGRLGSMFDQYTISWSMFHFNISRRAELLHDLLEIYRLGVTDAPRPACCPAPFDVENNWMYEFPTAYVIPVGAGQRSDAEANRLVSWLLFNGIEVRRLRADSTIAGQNVEQGSYVVLMNQAHRGLAETALGIGLDISNRIGILYAPPAAWSHGYLWGADVLQVPNGVPFTAPVTEPTTRATRLQTGIESGAADYYAIRVNSPAAVRAINRLLGQGLTAKLAQAPFTAQDGRTYPAGTVLFPFDPATKTTIGDAARIHDLFVRRVRGVTASLEEIDRSPRIAVFANAVDQSAWSLRNLGFTANPVGTTLLNGSPTDPLEGYDVIFSTANYPANTPGNATARARLAAFFARGGGYLGGGAAGITFPTSGGLVTGLAAGTRSGSGRSGIVYWNNTGGAASPITGAYPAQDTAIMDPPTWLTGVPAGWTVDANLPLSGFFAAGLWLLDAQSAGAPGAPVTVHGMDTANKARLAVFAAQPLYRADPEREWPALSSAAFWADQ